MSDWEPWNTDLIDCNPFTGAIKWRFRSKDKFTSEREYKSWNTRYALMAAFSCKTNGGYLSGTLNGKNYLSHRVVWAFLHGSWPSDEIDHINGKKTDNRIVNLRDVAHSANCRNASIGKNNTSGVVGVDLYRNKWRVRIGSGSSREEIGPFDNIDDAIVVRKAAEVRLGYHKNHGRPRITMPGAT